MSQSSFYYIVQNEKMVELSISEIYTLIDRSELWGNSWVFDPALMQWVLLNDLALFKRLDLNFKVSCEKFEKPKRVPVPAQPKSHPEENLHNMESHYLDDYISVFQTQIDKLLENNLKLIDENIKYKVAHTESKSEIEMLKFQTNLENQKIASENEAIHKQLKDQEDIIERQREELRQIKQTYQTNLEQHNEKMTELFNAQLSWSQKNQELTKNNRNKENVILQLEERIHALMKEKSELQRDLSGKLSSKEQELVEKINTWEQKYQKDTKELKNKLDQIEEELTQKYQKQVKELKLELELKEHQLKTQKAQEIPSPPKANIDNVQAIIEQATKAIEIKYQKIIEQKNKRIQVLLNKQKLMAAKYKEDFSKAQNAFQNYQQVINRQKQKANTLNSNMVELNQNLKQVQEDLELEKNKSQRLETLMNQQETLHEIADEKAKFQDEFVAYKELGKLFEISNAAHWQIRDENFEDLKLTLKEVRELLADGEITPETFVKREGKWWKKAKEVHELFLELREREENGEYHYYIERQSLRVPCGDKVEVLTDKAEFSGTCINISTGGCLISVLDLNTQIFKENDEVTIVFMSESLLFEFEIVGTIRNVDGQDKTLGLQFVDITDEEFDTITFYIDSFADKLEEDAA